MQSEKNMNTPVTPAQYDPSDTIATSPPGGPAWEIALLYPRQGSWSETDYLELGSNHLIEFKDGCVEMLPMPTLFHQLLVKYLQGVFDEYLRVHRTGLIVTAPMPVKLRAEQYREPDLVYLSHKRVVGKPRFPEGADLVIEVVSEGQMNRQRDLETKRVDYALAGIPEYWIVDPEQRSILVLVLEGTAYRVHGEFNSGVKATSVLLPGLSVAVEAMFAAAENP
jgi:Uma2 family endonuclease